MRAIEMVDWEFWGSKNAWIAIGVGGLMIILGILLWVFGIILGLALTVIGMAIMVVVGGYLAYWENWSLLEKKKGG